MSDPTGTQGEEPGGGGEGPSMGPATLAPSMGDPRRCSARNRRGEPCGRWAVLGASVCASHGGRAPQVRQAASRRVERAAAEQEARRTFGWVEGSEPVDIVGSVMTELRWCGAHVAWLRARVADLPDVVHDSRPHVLVTMLGEWVDRLGRMAAIAGRLGIEQRYVELAERTGAVMADVLAAVLGDLHLTPEQHEAAREAVPRHLRLVTALMEGLPAA